MKLTCREQAQEQLVKRLFLRLIFARRRFGRYEVIDFVAVLFGYAESFERTLETFYEWLHPFAAAFMALFGRDRLPSRSALSRWFAALDQAAAKALCCAHAFSPICWRAD